MPMNLTEVRVKVVKVNASEDTKEIQIFLRTLNEVKRIAKQRTTDTILLKKLSQGKISVPKDQSIEDVISKFSAAETMRAKIETKKISFLSNYSIEDKKNKK